MNNYIVYAHIFPNNKKYIGITKNNYLERWGRNGAGYKGQYVLDGILEFGWNNIKHLIVYRNLTEEEAKQKETELIAKYKTDNPDYGYNVSLGGGNQIISKHHAKTRRIVCINTQEIFISGKEAGLAHNIPKSSIHKCCNGTSDTAGGKVWQYYDEWLLKPKQIVSKRNGNSKKVKCIETGEVFDSVTDAARAMDCARETIRDVCKGKGKTAKGYHWSFIE